VTAKAGAVKRQLAQWSDGVRKDLRTKHRNPEEEAKDFRGKLRSGTVNEEYETIPIPI
jgi:hypothetical protein